MKSNDCDKCERHKISCKKWRAKNPNYEKSEKRKNYKKDWIIKKQKKKNIFTAGNSSTENVVIEREKDLLK